MSVVQGSVQLLRMQIGAFIVLSGISIHIVKDIIGLTTIVPRGQRDDHRSELLYTQT